MSHAQELITAIQSCNPGRLRAVIEQLNRLADDEVQHLSGSDLKWARKNYVNDRLTGHLDITALHLAAKAYSAHRDDKQLAPVFDEMVGDLLNAGASPFLEMGVKLCKQFVDGRDVWRKADGLTTAEVCEGHLPPTLAAWLAEHCDNTKSTNGCIGEVHQSTRKRREKDICAWRERKEAREKKNAAKSMTDAEIAAKAWQEHCASIPRLWRPSYA